jgi:hypothetical protein
VRTGRVLEESIVEVVIVSTRNFFGSGPLERLDDSKGRNIFKPCWHSSWGEIPCKELSCLRRDTPFFALLHELVEGGWDLMCW